LPLSDTPARASAPSGALLVGQLLAWSTRPWTAGHACTIHGGHPGDPSLPDREEAFLY